MNTYSNIQEKALRHPVSCSCLYKSPFAGIGTFMEYLRDHIKVVFEYLNGSQFKRIWMFAQKQYNGSVNISYGSGSSDP